MPKMDQLCTELEAEITRFKQESDKHRRLYRTLRYCVFGLTGSSTVLASVALGFTNLQHIMNLVVVSTTAAAGVVTSIEGLRKPAELWILERNVYYALTDLKREIKYRMVDGVNDKNADIYFGRMQGILASSMDKWSGQVQPQEIRGSAGVARPTPQ